MTAPSSPDAGAPPRPYLTQPLPDLAAWTRHFRDAEIPVLASTAQALEAMRANEDDVDAGRLSDVIQADPLMTVKVLAYVSSHRRRGLFTETETITSSLLLMGISPFFRAFGPQPTVEDRLRDQPLALEGLRELLACAERSARFALGFAVHRNDPDAAVIQLAAYLHDFAEMLLYCHAPMLALRLREAQRAQPGLRTASIQRGLLNVELEELGHALMKLCHLPELLVRVSDGGHPEHPAVRNVLLAARLARHTLHGWDDPALPDDIDALAQLLNASPRIALAYLHKIDNYL